MRWFSKNESDPSKSAWSYSATGILWRIVPSSLGYFIGEDRDTSTKRVSFFCVNRVTGETCWSGKNFSEPWWIGIEAVSGSTVFLHEYATPDMPDHKKIHAVDLLTGDVVWSNHELKLLFAHDDRVYAVQELFDKRIFFALDIATGAVVSEIDRENLNSLQRTLPDDPGQHVMYPLPASEVSLDSKAHANIQFALSKVNNPVLPEYLVRKNFMIVAYYENLDSTGTGFQQHLSVHSLNQRKILFRDIILNRAVIPVPDSFFCIDDFMYYVREKKTLMAVDLSGIGG